MGSRYLTDLADVCRRAGVPVVEVDGWQTRARGSGGYGSGCPDHVMIHHTASPASADGWPDVNYCTFSDDDAPLCNLYLNRGGTVWVSAAGATNTNGSGIDPCGVCPDDSMNSHAVGIEAGSNGTGERWPPAQCDAYLAVVAALCTGYDIPTGRVHAHAEWAPSRKVDPVGPDRWATGANTWDMAGFRADLKGDDEVTNDDIERIAERAADHVWSRLTVDALNGDEVSTLTLLRWAQADAKTGRDVMTETQGWVLLVEVGIIAAAYLVGLVRRGP